MQEFYRTRELSRTTKAVALRDAQLAMLHGRVKAGSIALTNRTLIHDEGSNQTTEQRGMQSVVQGEVKAPRFAVDRSAPYAHPYYWAPFFLMGNW